MGKRRTIVVAAALASAAAIAPHGARATAPPLPDAFSPKAVVAFVDTGINPYHKVFRDTSERAQQHPSTYLPGFPADAPALQLSLGETTYAKAVKRDCATWKSVQAGRMYWIPGTKIVGAISFNPTASLNCDTGVGGRILDGNGHGTMVSSRGAAPEYGACKTCLVVSVQFPGSVSYLSPGASLPPTLAAIRWAAENASWIDIQSNSWGPIAPLWEPTETLGLLTADPALVRAVEEVSQAHMAVWASGNGAAFRGGVAGHPTLLSPHLTPSAVMAGGHDSGYVNVWPGFPPHVVSDSCNSWAARRDSTTASGDSVGGGTSAATPFVAGSAGRLLLTARALLGDTRTGVRAGVYAQGPAGLVPSGPLADGTLTQAELKDVLFKTATARPKAQFEDGPPCGVGPYGPTPVKWADVPPEYPEFVHIGYGATDGPAAALGDQVLRGESPVPDRSRTDSYFAADAAARAVLHQVFRGP